MTGITGRVFPFTDCEAEGIKESYKDSLCFQGLFFPVIAENYGYQVTTFAALIIPGPCFFRLDKTPKMSYEAEHSFESCINLYTPKKPH